LLSRFGQGVAIPTRQGYDLAGVVLGGGGPAGTAKTLVMQHGITWTWHGNLKYLAPFLDRGWNLVMFNSRGHAGNQPLPPSYGWYEKADLADVVAWARRRFPDTRVLGLYGESMGAATILQALGDGLKADFAICDCAFSDLEAVARKELRRAHLPPWAARPVLWLARRLVRRVAGFDIGDIQPARAAANSRVPLLIMHGAMDGLAPVAMAKEIYEALPAACPARLEIFPDAYHAKSWASDPVRYQRIVEEFVAAHGGEKA
jgi:fermentation-respiration switch protein FrsA (DUF1100 family)